MNGGAEPTGSPPPPWCSEGSIWQLVECCGYAVDLPFWTEVARGSSGPVLDLGCGIGRVAHHLGRGGQAVIGLDSDPGVVADFNRASPGPEVTATVGDVTGPALDPAGSSAPGSLPDRFERILAPQQLIQIVGGAGERARLLAAVARRLSPGGIVALALTADLPWESIRLDLLPDVREIAGWAFMSRPVLIESEDDAVEITRVRHRVSPTGDLIETTDRIRFHRLTPAELAVELEAAGLVPAETIEVPATEAHVGSTIVTAGSAAG